MGKDYSLLLHVQREFSSFRKDYFSLRRRVPIHLKYFLSPLGRVKQTERITEEMAPLLRKMAQILVDQSSFLKEVPEYMLF